MKIAVVGVTGLVGKKILEVLDEFQFPVDELIPVASSRSAGREIIFRERSYEVVEISKAVNMNVDIALFSAGGEISKEWAPQFAKKGCKVIDNSSAWRMVDVIKLIVPEVNADILETKDQIIANPNCSTIQLVAAIAPLHKEFEIDRIVISTYQSVTGTGKAAVDQMELERSGKSGVQVYPHQIDKNCLPHCDVFLDNGYTKEEMKMVNETKKILDNSNLNITATAVRVPVTGGHGESVNITFKKEFDIKRINELLNEAEGVTVFDDPKRNMYPMPIISEGKNDVYVGRIRRDASFPRSLNMWIVADNLRKGAATNAVQIALYLKENNLI